MSKTYGSELKVKLSIIFMNTAKRYESTVNSFYCTKHLGEGGYEFVNLPANYQIMKVKLNKAETFTADAFVSENLQCCMGTFVCNNDYDV